MIKKLKFSKLKIINLFFLLGILLIGSDKISFEITGFNIRFIQLLFILISIYYLAFLKFRIKNLLLFLPFLIINIISLFFSYDFITSFGYILFTVYDYLIIYCLFYSWSISNSVATVYKIWKTTFFIHGILIVIEFILGYFGYNKFIFEINTFRGIPRPSIWFYEPSYLATYLGIFFSISLFLYISTNKKVYRNDMMFAFGFVLFITSTTGYISLFISFFLVLFFINSKNIFVKVKYIAIVFLILTFLFIIIYMIYPRFIDLFLGRVFTDGIVEASGDRISGWYKAFKVFLENPIFGVGPSAYQKYTNTNSPPTNVTLELLANTGLLGLVSFLLFFIGVIFKSLYKVKNIKSEKAIIVRAFIFAFVVFGIVLQANQNYLRIYMWMHLGIISGTSSRLWKEVKIKNENNI